MEELVETEESIERSSSVAIRKFMSQQMTLLMDWPGHNKGTQRCNILQAEELSQCRDMDLNVATQK